MCVCACVYACMPGLMFNKHFCILHGPIGLRSLLVKVPIYEPTRPFWELSSQNICMCFCRHAVVLRRLSAYICLPMNTYLSTIGSSVPLVTAVYTETYVVIKLHHVLYNNKCDSQSILTFTQDYITLYMTFISK